MTNPHHQETQLSMPLLIWVSWQRKKNVVSESESEGESESESEDESDDDEFNQYLARLTKKDKLMCSSS